MDKDKAVNYAVGYAPGKVILVGEHSAVYGHEAIALPIDAGVRVAITRLGLKNGPSIRGLGSFFMGQTFYFDRSSTQGIISQVFQYLMDKFGPRMQEVEIIVDGDLPRGHGLGSSAAFSVSLLRALSNYFSLQFGDADIAFHAHALENIFHGRSSGLDHTVVIKDQAISFQRIKEEMKIEIIELKVPISLVIGLAGPHDGTKNAVAKLFERKKRMQKIYDHIFLGLNGIAIEIKQALLDGNMAKMGELMNIAHGYLCALGVSTTEIDHLCSIAKNQGALGAKITGAGGGGAMIALANGNEDAILSAFNSAGFMAFKAAAGANNQNLR